MKEIFRSGSLILLVVAVLYIIFLRECKKPDPCPGENEMIVNKADWKSMIEAANKPPVIHIDTVYIKGETIYVPGIPVPGVTDNNPDPAVFSYADSLVQEDIDVRYYFVTEGRLLAKEWSYKPVQTVIHRIDSIPYPVPVNIIKEIRVSQGGLYLYGVAGGNADAFIFGGGLDYITRKNTQLGYQYQRYGSEGFHSVKLGIKLFDRK